MSEEYSNIIKRSELRNDLQEEIVQHLLKFQTTMSGFEGRALWEKWCWFIQGIDDLINIRHTLPPYVYDNIKDKPISNVCLMSFLIQQESSLVTAYFGEDVGVRLVQIIRLFSHLNMGWRIRYQPLFETIDDVINYCELRRLHYVNILYMIPLWCEEGKGKKEIEMDLLLNSIECSVLTAMRFRSALIQSYLLPDFHAVICNDGVCFSQEYNQLDERGLEPTPYSYVDVLKYRWASLGSIRSTSPNTLYDRNYLKDHLHNLPIYYQNYLLGNKLEFVQLKSLMNDLLKYCHDDYAIRISNEQYNHLSRKYDALTLYREPKDYFDALELRTLFFKCYDGYYSTILFATRYIDNVVFSLLQRNKKYQIDSGFVFEDAVSDILSESGFIRQKNCKRINRQEFDVVCIRDGEIYNFQCKNNYLDVRNMQINVASIVKNHRRLLSTYRRALKKERNRESLLMDKFHINKIHHYVISRYPVISNDMHIIPFNRLKEFIANNEYISL